MKATFSLLLLTTIVVSTGYAVVAQKPGKTEKVHRISRPETRFSSAEAFSSGSGAVVRWHMEIETQNYGFFVYRVNGRERIQVGPNMTLGSSSKVGSQPLFGSEYFIYDPNGDLNSFYVIETAPTNGRTIRTSPFSTKYIADLGALGIPKEQLQSSRRGSTIQQADLNLYSELQSEVKGYAQTPDPDTQRWLASIPGAKIGVKKTGIYHVTRAQLIAGGFDVSGSPDLWQLYTDGVQQAIIVDPNGEYIEFYGKGIDTPESDTRVYYLINGPGPGLRMGTRSARPGVSTLVANSYDQTFVRKDRKNYLDSILNGDAENYFGDLLSTTPYTLNFNLTGVDFNSASCTMTVRIQGYSNTVHTIAITLNGHALDPATGISSQSFSREYTLPTSFFQEGVNSLVLVATAASNDFSLFDTISVEYMRKHQAVENALPFYTQNYRAAILDGFSTANIRLFDISDDGNPLLVTNINPISIGATYGIKVNAAPKGRVLYAVEDGGLLVPASILANIPSTLSTPTHNANLVIIAYKDWLNEAQTWANYRSAQGTSVEVVNVEDIFDEYNYGVLSAGSVKSFLQYAKNNWQTPPQYVLLIGDASFDPRNYSNLGFSDFVPVKIVNTLFSETGSDDWLTDFNGDGLAEIAIGRVSAKTPTEVTDVLTKVATFEQPTHQSLDRGALFAYDVDPNFDFGAMSGRVRDQLPAGTPATMIGKTDINAQSNLISAMNTGKYIVNYSGHGSSGVWAGTGFFSNNNVTCSPGPTCISFPGNESIYTMLTCLNGYFFNPFSDSLAERLVKTTNGGAVASWASTGLTTPDVQEVMATRFYNEIGLGNMQRLGDLVLDAKSVVSGGSDVRLSWTLLGDPMLKVHPDPAVKMRAESLAPLQK